MPSIGRPTLNMQSCFKVLALSAVLLIQQVEAQAGWRVGTMVGVPCQTVCLNAGLVCSTRPGLIINPTEAAFVASITLGTTITAAPTAVPNPAQAVPNVLNNILNYASSVGTAPNTYDCTVPPSQGNNAFPFCCCATSTANAATECPFFPSSSPSDTPTKAPTDSPSQAPTKSVAPSNFPSSAPSPAPTKSVAPSNAPSLTPSNAPSNFPSAGPTGGKKAKNGIGGGGKKGGQPVPSPPTGGKKGGAGGPGPSTGGKKGGSDYYFGTQPVPSPTPPTDTKSGTKSSGKRRTLFSP